MENKKRPKGLFCVDLIKEYDYIIFGMKRGVKFLLLTKPIKFPKEADDGCRISVMSRHTLSDGRTLDPEITSESYDEWCLELAPPAKLVGDYYKRNISWDAYEKKYLDYLHQVQIRPILLSLIERSKSGNITLLCVEDTPEHCHRRLLAEECSRIDPSLEIKIR